MECGSPEDNTAVVKMVKDLYTFLGKSPPKKQRQKIDFSNSSSIFGQSLRSNNDSSSFLNTQRKRSRENDDITMLSRNEKAELILAKSKVSKLENEVVTLQTEKKKQQIEEEKLRKLNSWKDLKEQEKNESLCSQLNQVIKQQDEMTEELKTLRSNNDLLKQKYEKDTQNLETQVFTLKKKLAEQELTGTNNVAELNSKLSRQTNDLCMAHNSLKEAEAQLETFRNRQKEVQSMVANYNDLKGRCETAEHQVKVLEEKASRVDESALFMQKSQSELAKYRELEKENKKIKEDNKLYRDSADNALILHEKNEYLQSKLNKAETKIEALQNLEFENARLKSKLEKWECNEVCKGLSNVPRSPGELTRMIAELQKSQLMMIEQQGELETSINSRDTLLSSKEEECTRLHEVSLDLQTKNEQLEEKCQKLQRRLTLVSSDRDGLRRVLASFEKEETNAGKKQVQEAEDAVSRYIHQISQLEEELLQSRQDASRERTLHLQLQLEHEKLKSASLFRPERLETTNTCSPSDEKISNEFKEQLKELQGQYEKLKEERDHLQIFYDRRQLQGEYDPLKIKVLRLAHNPLQKAHQKHAEELQNVHKENERLRKKVIALQQAQQDALDESMNVSRLIKSSKPMEEARRQVESEKLKYKRLEEQYSKMAKDFRNAVCEFLGYNMKSTKDGTFRLQSIYSGPDDFFLFTCSKSKSGLLDTEYMNQWSQFMEEYIQNGDSFPAFLAAVTLQLFNKTTQLHDNTQTSGVN